MITKSDKQLLTDNRFAVMGFAALLIMLFHSTINFECYVLNNFKNLGYLGVDVFMFLSGFSMYRSFKECDNHMFLFYYKRIKKIVPTFIPFLIVWLISFLIDEAGKNIDLVNAVASMDFLMLLITFRWFIPCICLCYLITPIIAKILWENNKFKDIFFAVLISALFLFAVPFVVIGSSVALMMLLRIPEYVIGYYYAGLSERRVRLVFRIILLAAMFFIYFYLLGKYSHLFLCDSGLYWWPAVFGCSSITICIASVKLFRNIIFEFLGRHSLELYLWHQFILYPCERLFASWGWKLDRYGIGINLLIMILTCGLAWAYSVLIDKFSDMAVDAARKGNI